MNLSRGSWPAARLGDILTRSRDWVTLEPDRRYRQVTVRLWGKGVVVRDEVDGLEIASARRLRVRSGQLILSRIDARNGAIGIVPDALHGAIVSNDFPAFDVDTSRVLPAYLGWLTRTPSFVDACRAASEGTTNRIRLVEDRFLAIEIPLPSLDAQRRIVARFVQAEGLIKSGSRLFSEVTTQATALLTAEELRIWPESALAGAPTLRGVTSYLARGRQSHQGASEHHLIKTQHVQMGRYVPTTVTLSAEAAAKVDPAGTVRSGDVLIACSAAGCLGRVAMFEEEGRIASTDTHVAVARPARGVVLPEYLYAYLRGAQGQVQLRSRERGDWQREKVGFRLTELNLRDLEQVPVPVPSLSDQRRVVARVTELRSKLEELEQHQQAQVHRLGNLLVGLLSQAFGAGEAGPGGTTH